LAGRPSSSRAPRAFVQNPEALIGVRDELRRIREARGTDLELDEDDDVSANVDNARRLHDTLTSAKAELEERDRAELERFTAERLVEASLRYR